MKIRYVLIITLLAAAIGYTTGAANATETQQAERPCLEANGCIDFAAHPELIGGGVVYEPTPPEVEEEGHEI